MSRPAPPPRSRTRLAGWLLALCGCTAGLAGASEPAPPAHFAHGLGESVHLSVDGGFFALRHRPPQPRGWIILLNDAGVTPYAPGLLRDLHDQLPTRGWATLTIELPATADSADDWVDAARQRLGATIVWLQQRNEYAIVAIGHGLGALAALHHAGRATHGLRGIVAIDIDTPLHVAAGHDGRGASFHAVSSARLPLLDLYHEAGQTAVQAAAEQRLVAARLGGNEQYSWLALGDRDGHHGDPFTARRIAGWLERHADHIAAGQPARRR